MTQDTVKTEKASVYEVGFHIVPAVSPETLPKEVDAIKAVLGKQGATIISEEAPKMRPLSYPMTKAIGQSRATYETAYFGWIKFEAPVGSVAEINKAMDANEKVLRYLLIKTVRENTLYGAKILAEEKKEEESEKEAAKPAAQADKPALSAEELDKSIDKLVV
jgi:ribosomal protein S6